VDKSTALVNDNTVRNNKKAGIGCREGRVTIENNNTYENLMAGIGLDGAKETFIIGNEIHNNGTSGFWAKIKNLFSKTAGVGVGMKKSEVLIFSANTITNNALPGLAVTEGSSIEKGEGNFLRENGSSWAANLALLDQSRAVLSDTTILEGDTANVYLSNSRLTLNNCRVKKGWRPGVVAEDGSVVKIEGGSISHNGAMGVLLEKSSGELKGVLISGNEHHGIGAEGNSFVKVEDCTITNNSAHGGAGVDVDSSEAYLANNLIHHNESVGVEADGGTLVLWNNVLADQEQGIELEGSVVLDARNNIFANHKAEGLEMEKSVQIKHFSHNNFWNNGDSSGRRPKILNFLPTPSKEEDDEDKDDDEEEEGVNLKKGNLQVNPGFINPAAGDYRLKPGSPLIDAGTDVGLPFTGKAPNIGGAGIIPDL
jgi:parallel beta-helix repeat protein